MRLPFITAWQDRRDEAWWDRLRREHRWDALADYNHRVSQGIVHTPAFVALMAEEQAAFDLERGGIGAAGDGFPFTLPGLQPGRQP